MRLPTRPRLRAPLFGAALALLTPGLAIAEESVAVAGTLANVRASDNDGFEDLKWGSDLKTIYARYPELKKFYPQAKIVSILKAGRTAVLETKLKFKGVAYNGKLVLDAQGLFRATIEVKVVEDPETPVPMDKALDPLLGDLSAPDEESPDTRLWKGTGSVIAVSKNRGFGSYRLDISFYSKASYRPENAGGSLGIE